MNYFNDFEAKKEELILKMQEVSEEIDALIDRTEKVKLEVPKADFVFSCLIGIVGAFVSNDKTLNQLLRAVHDGPKAAKVNEDSILYPVLDKLHKFFRHEGDWIDQPFKGEGFIGRDGSKVPIYAHRIRWGHDVFSTSGDNPFVLSTKQYGKFKGVFRAIKHLTADTFSSQGLPIPFHSYFDVGSTNLIEEWIKKIARNSVNVSGSPGEFSFVLRKVFSINAQDVIASTLVVTLANLYVKFKPIEYSLKARSFKLSSYSVSLLVNLGYNLIVYKVPAINWSLVPFILKEVIFLYKEKGKIEREIAKRMDLLLKKTKEIEEENKRLLSLLKKRSMQDELIHLDKEFLFFLNF